MLVKERVDRLEAIVGEFIVQTNTALVRMERSMEEFKDEMRAFKDNAEKQIREMNRQWGNLAQKLGTVVEDIVAPSIPRIAKEYFGCETIEDFMVWRQVVNKKDRSKRREFDVIAVCENTVILNETKEYVRIAYIDEFIEFLKSEEWYDYFPEYKGKGLISLFSSLYLGVDVINYLTRNVIYAVGMKDDVMEVLNFQQVKEREGKKNEVSS
jgi:hypothetical protein